MNGQHAMRSVTGAAWSRHHSDGTMTMAADLLNNGNVVVQYEAGTHGWRDADSWARRIRPGVRLRASVPMPNRPGWIVRTYGIGR